MMEKTCYLCKSKVDDELLLGKFYTKWKLSVHYYCLLLSSNLVQNGLSDTAGIFGFLEQDIRTENERTKKYRCYICKHMHANISCCAKKCLRSFHTVCGLKNRCLSHYTGTFQSWCSAHVPLEPEDDTHTATEPCSICYDDMGTYDQITSVRAPCCRNGWFHHRCLAKYAQSSGYFFKCPLCKNEDKFLSEIPLRGVFVPERDAAWELEPNAFQEQLLRPTACDADPCKCENFHAENKRDRKLIICEACGSTCRHRMCMESSQTRSYVCKLCRPIVGERVCNETNDTEDSEDDNVSSSSSSTNTNRTSGNVGAGSESGVHCSSSDETLSAIRSRARKRSRIQSFESDIDQSDASSIQIKRCVRQNAGKRVRRVACPAIDSESSSSAGEHEPSEPPAKLATDEFVGEISDEQKDPSVDKHGKLHAPEKSAPWESLDGNSSESDTSSSTIGKTRKRPGKAYAVQKVSSLSDCSDMEPGSITGAVTSRTLTTSPHSNPKRNRPNVKYFSSASNTSNEENISPSSSPPSHLAPVASGSASKGNGPSHSSPEQKQQLILKYITHSSQKKAAKEISSASDSMDESPCSSVATNSKASSFASSSSGSTNRRSQKKRRGQQQKQRSAIGAKRRRRDPRKYDDTDSEGEKGCEKSSASMRHPRNGNAKTDKGQQNLLNYFTRC